MVYLFLWSAYLPNWHLVLPQSKQLLFRTGRGHGRRITFQGLHNQRVQLGSTATAIREERPSRSQCHSIIVSLTSTFSEDAISDWAVTSEPTTGARLSATHINYVSVTWITLETIWQDILSLQSTILTLICREEGHGSSNKCLDNSNGFLWFHAKSLCPLWVICF